MEQQPVVDQKIAIRKRTQIEKANRTMFVWVAFGSVIVGICLVAIIFLGQMLIFNEKVLSEKGRTIATLKANNANIPALQTEVEKLDTNQALIDSKAYDDDNAVQVILDALPSDANSLALGASLQTKLLNIPGLSVDMMVVDPVQGIESFDANSSVVDSAIAAETGQSQINFRIKISGKADVLKQALVNLEKSIRTINVTKIKIESSTSTSTTMTVEGCGYYEPAKIVELEDKVVK